MAKRITAGKHPSGHPLRGKPLKSGGPGFVGAKGSGANRNSTLLGGSRSGGKRITKKR